MLEAWCRAARRKAGLGSHRSVSVSQRMRVAQAHARFLIQQRSEVLYLASDIFPCQYCLHPHLFLFSRGGTGKWAAYDEVAYVRSVGESANARADTTHAYRHELHTSAAKADPIVCAHVRVHEQHHDERDEPNVLLLMLLEHTYSVAS